ncbi:helix-turn-helix transcriptional regulator [Rubrivirga sp.]|uniref:helix-turn-helix transcriptional regulator n=1 Tax=Rubrivirga sp. TaxID=1885344 RepID=UPI003C73A62B
MKRSSIKPHLTQLSGSGTRLGPVTVERIVDDPDAPGSGDGATGPARHVLVVPVGVTQRLTWQSHGAEQRSEFSDGDSILNPAGLDTRPRWSGPVELVLLAVAPSTLDHVAEQTGRCSSAELVPNYEIRDPLLHQLALTLAAEFEREEKPDLLYAESLTQALVAHLVKEHSVEGARTLTVGRGLAAETLQLVTDYVSARLASTITLAEIASIAGYSPSHFIDLFRRSTGQTPHQYVIERRIREAQRLLTETEDTIATVAYQTGFSDQSHLTRTMRRRLGITPGELRAT